MKPRTAMTFEWDPSLTLGVQAIDDQHRELVRRIGALVADVDAERKGDEVFRTLAFLGSYVLTHFGDEEALMRSTGYPDFEAHALEHRGFLEAFTRMRSVFARSGISEHLVADVDRQVCAWFRDHVSVHDRALAAYIHARARS